MEKEYRCKYCGAKAVKYANICGQCREKLKLVRQLRQICEQIKKEAKPKPKLIDLNKLDEALTTAYRTAFEDNRTDFACGILLAKDIARNQLRFESEVELE